MVICVLKYPTWLGTPEGGSWRLKTGDLFHSWFVTYPGMPDVRDNEYSDWTFWTNADIDGAFILKQGYVAEVRLTAETRPQLRAALLQAEADGTLPFRLVLD
jgi:hypothetical protein